MLKRRGADSEKVSDRVQGGGEFFCLGKFEWQVPREEDLKGKVAVVAGHKPPVRDAAKIARS